MAFLNHVTNASEFRIDFNPVKNKIQVYNLSDRLIANIKLPWILPFFSTVNDLLQNVSTDYIRYLKYLIILIQAGYSAVCHCENGQIVGHKLVRKYMVRKKQGKAQITYLNKKGKSRAGSRIRLAQTVQFFEEINVQVNLWITDVEPDRMLISCPPRLWGLLFQSKIKPEFSKKDERIFKIPADIKVADRSELSRINTMAQKCIIEFEGEPDQNWLKLI